MTTVRNLLQGMEYVLIEGNSDVPIDAVAYDSRKVTTGTLFVCVKGYVADGHTFLEKAAAAGATAAVIQKDQTVISPDELARIAKEHGVTILAVDHTRQALAHIASNFFGKPSGQLAIYGITGTKGKTTTTYMVRDVLLRAGHSTGLVGTVANIIGEEVRPASHTTPESYELQSVLAEMVAAGSDSCVMEVSSQGLMLDRVFGMRFAVGAFTNLYHDHIGPTEHANMEEYLDAKRKIFDRCEVGLINTDTPVSQDLIAYAKERTSVITFGIESSADVRAVHLTKQLRGDRIGTTFLLESPWYNGECYVGMPGKFNVYNALCATAVAGVAGVPYAKVLESLADVRVPGRIQPVPNDLGFQVYVDYAHNAASLENVLVTLREYCEGKLITVFGCGGNRSKTRRFEMGEVSGRLSDLTIITSDNPRSEEPMDIIADILVGFDKTEGTREVEPDRRSAILRALSIAKPGDFVLIAGKGHENYQIFKDRTIHFDDAQTALELLGDLHV